jgi:hypothetical protein
MSLTISHARDVAGPRSPLRMDDFADLRQTGQGSITVGHAKYRIRIDNGLATATADNFNAKFRAPFGHRRRNLQDALNARLFRMTDYEAGKEIKTDVIRYGFKNVHVTHTRDLNGPGPSKGLTGAAYGFDGNFYIRNRIVGKIATEPATFAGLLTIDTLNACFGLRCVFNATFPTPDMNALRTMLNPEAIRSMPLDPEASPADIPLATAWKAFLQHKIDVGTAKLDIFEKLDKMRLSSLTKEKGELTDLQFRRLHANGLDGEIGDALMKNSGLLFKDRSGIERTPEDQKELLASSVALFKELLLLPNPEDRVTALENRRGTEEPFNDAALIVEQACFTHFFRQTSKMGLNFFTQQGMDVNFWLQKPDERTVDSADTLVGAAIKQRRGEGHNEAITFSEMRHAMRMRAAGIGGQIKFITTATS